MRRCLSHRIASFLTQQAALQKLHQVVDTHWVEVADAVAQIESLAEDDLFPARTLAASVASKVERQRDP